MLPVWSRLNVALGIAAGVMSMVVVGLAVSSGDAAAHKRQCAWVGPGGRAVYICKQRI
jgi:hypothetical protein